MSCRVAMWVCEMKMGISVLGHVVLPGVSEMKMAISVLGHVVLPCGSVR